MNKLPAGTKINISHPKAYMAIVYLDGEKVEQCVEARSGRKGYALVIADPIKIDKRGRVRNKRLRGNVEVVFE